MRGRQGVRSPTTVASPKGSSTGTAPESPGEICPQEFGPWQTGWKRQRRWAADGTWDTVLAKLTAQADSIDGIDWTVSVDSTINRAHQHGHEHGPAGEGHRRCHLPQHERSSCDRG